MTLVLALSSSDPLVVAVVGALFGGVLVTLADRGLGSVLSLAGVHLYWYSTDFSEPSTLIVAGLTMAGVLSLVGTLFGETVAERFGRPSRLSIGLAGLAGVVLLALSAPIAGLGVALLVVFLVEYRRKRRVGSATAVVFATVVGSIATRDVRVLLTGSILAVMLVVLFL
ncbi:DUF456 family protein [Halovenus marina]|uniref:DUF456 family protein n=1 Tax=Halovenus marina TaxID=3396621 RepID=UPI003F55B7AC